jgi:predicted dehydrogenase
MTELRAAVIGAGYLGRFHAQKYRQIPGVTLVAVVDADPERARSVGEELGVPWLTDLQALAGQAVDLVSVAVPTARHFEVARECFQAGWSVLLEKPVTVTLEEADALIAMARQEGRQFQVGHIKRFHPGIMALQRSGWLTQPRYVRLHRLAPFKPRAIDVDVVLDLMIHDIDVLAMLTPGTSIRDVEALGAPVLTRMTDMATARLRLTDGCVADLTVSRVAQQATRRLELFQEESHVTLDFMTMAVQRQRVHGGSIVTETLPVTGHDALEAEIRAFCTAVRDNTAPVVDGTMGRHALAVALQVQQAIRDHAVTAGSGAGGSVRIS